MLLTWAELGHRNAVRSQEISLALFTVRWLSACLLDVLFFSNLVSGWLRSMFLCPPCLIDILLGAVNL